MSEAVLMSDMPLETSCNFLTAVFMRRDASDAQSSSVTGLGVDMYPTPRDSMPSEFVAGAHILAEFGWTETPGNCHRYWEVKQPDQG